MADNPDLESQVAAHREALEDVMDSIDERQATVDALREQIADTSIAVARLEDGLMQQRSVHRACELAGGVSTEPGDFDVASLNAEHRDWVRAALDRIHEVEASADAEDARNAALAEERDALVRENDGLDRALGLHRRELDVARREARRVRAETRAAQARARELSIAVSANGQTLAITDRAIAGLAERASDLETRDGGLIDLGKAAAALEDAIAGACEDAEAARAEHAAALARLNIKLDGHVDRRRTGPGARGPGRAGARRGAPDRGRPGGRAREGRAPRGPEDGVRPRREGRRGCAGRGRPR